MHIALDEEVWLDVDAFAQAHELVRGIDGSALVPAQVDELARGGPLPRRSARGLVLTPGVRSTVSAITRCTW